MNIKPLIDCTFGYLPDMSIEERIDILERIALTFESEGDVEMARRIRFAVRHAQSEINFREDFRHER